MSSFRSGKGVTTNEHARLIVHAATPINLPHHPVEKKHASITTISKIQSSSNSAEALRKWDWSRFTIEEEYIMSTPKTSWPQVVGWPATAAVSPASGSGCFGFFLSRMTEPIIYEVHRNYMAYLIETIWLNLETVTYKNKTLLQHNTKQDHTTPSSLVASLSLTLLS